MSTNEEVCCPKFDPEPWADKVITFDNKLFLKDRVTSFLRIPLNFGAVMKRSMATIEAAGAMSDDVLVLSDENSLWGADVYIAISKDIPGARTATLSGTFFTKAFEGSYSSVGEWIKDMTAAVTARGDTLRKLFFFYTTCPKCAKKYGKNYVVILAQI